MFPGILSFKEMENDEILLSVLPNPELFPNTRKVNVCCYDKSKKGSSFIW